MLENLPVVVQGTGEVSSMLQVVDKRVKGQAIYQEANRQIRQRNRPTQTIGLSVPNETHCRGVTMLDQWIDAESKPHA